MSYEQKLNTGAIFKNTDKQKDTHPDYRGKFKIDPSIIDENGEIEISLWLSTSQNGLKQMSGKLAQPWKNEEKTNQEALMTVT